MKQYMVMIKKSFQTLFFCNSKPFRRFRAILDNSEEHLQQWYAFRDLCLRKFIADWAEANQIEIDFDK